MITLLWIGGSIVALIVLISILIKMYTVVDPNEAHILVVMGKGRKLYAPKFKGQEKVEVKTSYFYIPFLMTRTILPLTNVKMGIPNIHLNDTNVAPFVCDVIAWVHISDPVMAAERLSSNSDGNVFTSLQDDLINVVQATARAAAMSMEVLEIMKNRKPFAERVSKEVNDVLVKFGVELVNLEVNDIKDDEQKESRIIADYESIRKQEINTKARKEIAIKNKEAILVEQQNLEESEIATAKATEAYTKKNIEKDRNIGKADMNKVKDIAEAEEAANVQKVSAKRTLDVGNAIVEKEATVQRATGEAEAIRVTGAKEAEVIELKGRADGAAIEAKGRATAVSKDKLADAMKKFNESATVIEKIAAWKEVEKAKYEALGMALSEADLKLVQSGSGQSIFGFPLNAESGADIGQFMKAMDNDTISKVAGKLGMSVDGIKDAVKKLVNSDERDDS